MTDFAPTLLISRIPTLSLDAFNLRSSDPYFIAYDGALGPTVKSTGTFPTAGVSSPSPVTLTYDSVTKILTFPGPGEYYFYCALGAFKVLILPTQTVLEDMIAVLGFVSRNIIHSAGDVWMAYPIGTDYASYFDGSNLACKFFYSDQPLQLQCGDSARFLALCLWRLGIQTRRVWIHDATGNGHILIEGYDPDAAQWVWLDADFGVYVEDASGKPLSGDQIAATPDLTTLRIIDVGKKCWTQGQWNQPFTFMGHCSWSPDHMSTLACGDQAAYVQMLQRFVVSVVYHELSLTADNYWHLITGSQISVTVRS